MNINALHLHINSINTHIMVFTFRDRYNLNYTSYHIPANYETIFFPNSFSPITIHSNLNFSCFEFQVFRIFIFPNNNSLLRKFKLSWCSEKLGHFETKCEILNLYSGAKLFQEPIKKYFLHNKPLNFPN